MFFLLLFILPGMRTQDPTPQSYLQQHRLPFSTVQFLQNKEHAKKGPILFPNDAPPPPPTPLIVTSRPLSESIAKSELNSNSSVAAQSQYHQVTFRPNYLDRGKNYDPYSYTLATVTPVYDYDAAQINEERKGKLFKDYELRVVKPLYEIDNAQRQQNTAYKYKNSPNEYYQDKNKGDEHDYSQQTNPSDNYAFSYTVKDHKTGDDFSHSQKSTGSATNGEYRVLLPDGRTQIVSYTADENGYKADVRYDEHPNQENSVDFGYDKDKSLGNNDRPKVIQNYGHSQDYIQNEDFLHRPQQTPAPYKANHPNYEHRLVENINDYGDKNDNNFQYYNIYPSKAAFVRTTANINDRTLDGLSDNNNDYFEQYNARLENNDKVEKAKDDYKFSDELDFSKEVVDYSSELDHAYAPHKSKFSLHFNNQNAQAQSQVRPSYDELKPLFVTNANGRRNIATPVSTVRPVYAVTPADVVAITPKKPIHNLYTNIKNIVTPAPFIFSTPSPSTPRSYLLSTIANLKHQISLANKPVLSEHYINKINKYLSYSNPVKVNK